ncbi:MAG: DoxX family protein [Planctomycetota bacterium]
MNQIARLGIKVGNALRPLILLGIRVILGWQLLIAGIGKLQNIDRTVGFFTNLGIPMPQANAYLVGSVETIGGFLLIVGLLTRLAALPLSITMITALATAHKQDVVDAFALVAKTGPTGAPEGVTFPFLDFTKLISSSPFPFLVGCLVLLTVGAGGLSIDFLLGKKLGFKEEGGPST